MVGQRNDVRLMNGDFHLPLPQATVCYFAGRFPCCWFALSYAGGWRALALPEYPTAASATRFLE